MITTDLVSIDSLSNLFWTGVDTASEHPWMLTASIITAIAVPIIFRECIKIEKTEDTNGQNSRSLGKLLHKATNYGDLEQIKALLTAGADVNAKRNSGWTPLHFACNLNHADIVELLLKAGADVNAKSNTGRTPLHWACDSNDEDIVELLLKAGADIRQRNSFNELPFGEIPPKSALWSRISDHAKALIIKQYPLTKTKANIFEFI